MAQDVELAIPCRLVTLSLLLGPEDGLTTLEDLVAKAIAAGRSTVEDQADLFALPRRIVLDVVHSLWRKGHIMVGFQDGTLELTDGAREVIASGGSLRDSAAKQEHRQFLFEPVTGRVFPADHGTRQPSVGSLHVPLHQVLSETDLPADELLRAVQTAIRNDRRSRGFRQNVLDVGFRSPVLRPASELRWLSAQAQVFLDNDTGRISAQLLERDQPGWNSRSRERMRQHLADLAQQQPDHKFVQALRGRADVQLVAPESADSLLRRMGEAVRALADAEPEHIGVRQKFLADLSQRLSARIAETGRAKAAVVVVARAAGHEWTVKDLIQSARTQLVFSAPDISYAALSGLLPDLRKALERGVHLVFLWGGREGDILPNRVRTALFDLEARHPSKVLFTDRSARTAACVVVQDNQRAFVGTHSPLSVDIARDTRGEVGILVEGTAQDGPPGTPQCVTDLLIWARKSFPYWQLGQRILIQDDSFGPVPERRRAEPVAAVLPPGEEEGHVDRLRQDPAARALWVESWVEHHAVLSGALRRATEGDPVVEILEDGAPRDLVQQALHSATRRLVLADDSSDAQASDERFVAALGERLDQGVAVQLIRPAGRGQERTPAQPELKALIRRGLKVRDERAGARAAIWDDEAIIGSLPLLHDRRRTLRPSERTSHVGVHVRGTAAATTIAAELGVPAELRTEPETVAEPGSRLSGATAVALSLLVDAAAERGSARYAAIVAERLRQVDDLWGVLDVWHSKVRPEDMRPVVAAALLQEQESRDEHWSRWAGWLVAEAWDRRAFVEASLLGRLLHGAQGAVHPAACTAAVALETGPLGPVLSEAALELSYSELPAQAVGAAAGLAETLLRAVPDDGLIALALLDEALPPSWQELAATAKRHREAGHGPLPLALLASELSRMTELSETAEQWEELVDQIDRMKRLHRFTFDSGKFLHRELFARDGMLTAIRAAAEGSAEDCARMQDSLPVHVRRHLDQIVADGGRPEIQWGNQRTFLQTIEDIVRRARSIAPMPNGPGSTAATAPEAAGCEELAKLIADKWDALFSDANGLGRPFASPLLALLDRLDPLAQWQRSQRRRRTDDR
ncbi:hypothetical protein ACFWMX_15815 [Streptomyces sp. NPDC058378]|uniref:hypothetical protein n=1 Tax=Streptomyces sp. NPDC058378 TaxID=3346469 RepID=UPI00364EFFF2